LLGQPLECFHERQAFFACQELTEVVSGWRRCTRRQPCLVEKKCWWDLQNLGQSMQPACANPVHAFFVFLNLLECYAERISQRRLAQSKRHAPQTDLVSDIAVDGIVLFFSFHAAFTSPSAVSEGVVPMINPLKPERRLRGGELPISAGRGLVLCCQ